MLQNLNFDDGAFGWTRLSSLLGRSINSHEFGELFRGINIQWKKLFKEERKGIYSMPPYDKQPCPNGELDFSSQCGVRLHFTHASLLPGGEPFPPTEFLFFAVTYYLEQDEGLSAFSGDLPFGILHTDDKSRAVARASNPPNIDTFQTTDIDIAYLRWVGNPLNIHIAFRVSTGHPFLVQCYMKQKEI